jgi:hypothetical protein
MRVRFWRYSAVRSLTAFERALPDSLGSLLWAAIEIFSPSVRHQERLGNSAVVIARNFAHCLLTQRCVWKIYEGLVTGM